MHVKPYGAVGQVEPVFCNIRDDASVAQVMAGADAVVNCVGILNESGANSFWTRWQAEGRGPDCPDRGGAGRWTIGASVGHRRGYRRGQQLCPDQG